MAKGVRFFMNAEDEHDFAENVLRRNELVLMPQNFHSGTFPEFRYPAEANNLEWRLQLVIWNKAICEHVTIKQYPKFYRIDTDNDLVISLQRSFVCGRILVAGALAVEMYRLDRVKMQLVHRGEELEKWYNSLARWLRRNYKRESNDGIYVGPKTQKSVERGEIELAPYLIARDSN